MGMITFKDAEEIAQKTANEWAKTNLTEAAIIRRVLDSLEKQFDQLIPEILGFENRGFGWELDHCNGRAGESVLGGMIRQSAQKAVDALQTDLENWKPKPAMMQAIRKEFAEVVQRHMREDTHRRATVVAQQYVNDVVNKAIEHLNEPDSTDSE
jgi:hypothetical protein